MEGRVCEKDEEDRMMFPEVDGGSKKFVIRWDILRRVSTVGADRRG
jgi:hypothetical protein